MRVCSLAVCLLVASIAIAAQPEDCNTAQALCEMQATAAYSAWGDAIADEGTASDQYADAWNARPGCTDQQKLDDGDDALGYGDSDNSFALFLFAQGDRNMSTAVQYHTSADDAYAQQQYDNAQTYYELAEVEYAFAIDYYGQASDYWAIGDCAAGHYLDAETLYLEGTPMP